MRNRNLLLFAPTLLLLAAAGSPKGAFANLYAMAKQMNQDPTPFAKPLTVGDNPSFTFPQPQEAADAWDASLKNRGKELKDPDRKLLLDCAPKLKDAIQDRGRAYIIQVTQLDNNYAVMTAEDRIDKQNSVASLKTQATTEIEGCSSANDAALAGLKTKPQTGGVSTSAPGSAGNQPPLGPASGYGTVLPAMTGQGPIGNETFEVNLPAGAVVGQAFNGAVSGTLGTTIFSRAQGTITSTTTFQVTALWDKAGNPYPLQSPVNVTIGPQN